MISTDTTSRPSPAAHEGLAAPRAFDFERDTFAYPNELHWAYDFDAATGKATFSKRNPPPHYALRCFVLARAARQFLYHAQFDSTRPAADTETYRHRIREVVSSNPRVPCAPDSRIVFPGFASLREFSAAWAPLLKAECGGAWRSYVLRSHWRMVFPISRRHQSATSASLKFAIGHGTCPIIHLVCFPKLTINHGMVLFAATPTTAGIEFAAYDPNDPSKPACIRYDNAAETFHLPANAYWAGGPLDIIEIYRSWLF